MDDITDSLQALMSRGYKFAQTRGAAGEVVTVVGVRAHHNVIDIVQLYGERDTSAVRIPGDEPDILFPRTVLWRASGIARDVIGKLLALADPVADSAPVGSEGCWFPTRPGRSVWLASQTDYA
jgi:hypothetical protein